jgi:hypothetical protein
MKRTAKKRENLPIWISGREITGELSGIFEPAGPAVHLKNTETIKYAYRFPDPS